MSSNPNSLSIQYCLSIERALKIILQNLRQCRLARAAIEGKPTSFSWKKIKLQKISWLKNKNYESIKDFYACRFYHSLLLNELSNGRNLAEDLLVAYVRTGELNSTLCMQKFWNFKRKAKSGLNILNSRVNFNKLLVH